MILSKIIIVFLFFCFSKKVCSSSSDPIFDEEEIASIERKGLVNQTEESKKDRSSFRYLSFLPSYCCRWACDKIKKYVCWGKSNVLYVNSRNIFILPSDLVKKTLHYLDPISLSILLKTSKNFNFLMNDFFLIEYSKRYVLEPPLQISGSFNNATLPRIILHKKIVAEYLFEIGIEKQDYRLLNKSAQLGSQRALDFFLLQPEHPHSTSWFCNCRECINLRRTPEYYFEENL